MRRTRKRRSGIPRTRRILYGLARLLGDYDAVRKRRVKERIWRRLIGNLVGRSGVFGRNKRK